MKEKVSEKEKLYQRATKAVEKLVAKGMQLTTARNRVREKFGLGNVKMVELTKHLSTKRPYPTEEE